MQPILSICIPTFNRSPQLENLMSKIFEIKKIFIDEVEICISNNCSTDNTSMIISKWSQNFSIRTITQVANIGANKNIIEVTRLATGKWILLIGDDDEINIDFFKDLIKFLTKNKSKDWIIVGVKVGERNLLGDVKQGKYLSYKFRNEILRTGLFRYGLIGSHIFSSSLIKDLSSFTAQQYQTWPHVALLLQHLTSSKLEEDGCVFVFPEIVVIQAGGGDVTFFDIGDWVITNIKKIDILSELKKIHNHKLFYYSLMLRELYSLMCLKEVILWRILEPKDFKNRALTEFAKRYFHLGPLISLAFIHFILILFLFILPNFFIKLIIQLTRKNNIQNDYFNNKNMKSEFDTIKRGI